MPTSPRKRRIAIACAAVALMAVAWMLLVDDITVRTRPPVFAVSVTSGQTLSGFHIDGTTASIELGVSQIITEPDTGIVRIRHVVVARVGGSNLFLWKPE